MTATELPPPLPSLETLGPLEASSASLARRLYDHKLVRYLMVSVVAVAISQVTLAITFGVLGWAAVPANATATALATIPSYTLNRAWVWGRTGRSHLRNEVLPFWVLAFISLVLSTLAARAAEQAVAGLDTSRALATALVMAATLAAFGVLWVLRFVLLNRVLFRD